MEEEATQPSTQQLPVHNGVAPSSKSNSLAGVICILHPNSPAAYLATHRLASRSPEHILKMPKDHDPNKPPSIIDPPKIEEPGVVEPTQATQVGTHDDDDSALDIALRYEPGPKDPTQGFVFGRSPEKCDILLGEFHKGKRVSNAHFRIFMNPSGILMIEDTSTNGTWVDDVRLAGVICRTRILVPGSLVSLDPGKEGGIMKFVVRVPKSDGTALQQEVPSQVPASTPETQVHKIPRLNPAVNPLSPQRNAAALQRTTIKPTIKPPRNRMLHSTKPPVVAYQWTGGGKYNLQETIGKGAFATVTKAVSNTTGDVFAVKTIAKRTFAAQGGASKTVGVRREVEILKRLNHSKIVTYVDSDEDSTHIFIVMEFINGGDLSGYLRKHTRMPEHLAQEVARQVLTGIEYVHGKGISHRDLKPDNILVVSEDPIEVKISDFGLAKMIQNEETFLKTFCGTMLYLAPEVFPGYIAANQKRVVGEGKRKRHPGEDVGKEKRNKSTKYNQAVDMWSFGCVMYVLLTGKPPFEGKNQEEMFYCITKGSYNTKLLNEYGNAWCQDFIRRLLQVDPGMRMMEREALKHQWLDEGREDSDENFEFVSAEETKCEDSDGLEMPNQEALQELELRGKVALMNVSGKHQANNHEVSNDSFASLPGASREFGGEFERATERLLLGGEPTDGLMLSRLPFSLRRSSEVLPARDYSMWARRQRQRQQQDQKQSQDGSQEDNQKDNQEDGQQDNQQDDGQQGRENTQPQHRHRHPFEYDPMASMDEASSSDGKTETKEELSIDAAPFSSIVGNPSFNAPFAPPSLQTPSAPLSPKTPSAPPSLGNFPGNLTRASHAQLKGSSSSSLYSSEESSTSDLCRPPTAIENLPGTQVVDYANMSDTNPICTPWGRLVPLPNSLPHPIILLNRHQISVGRSATCTFTEGDLRISKHHLALQLDDPSKNYEPFDRSSWRPTESMCAWYLSGATNGLFLNRKRKIKGRVGRIYNGDELYLFKDSSAQEQLGFRCELTIGNHERDPVHNSDSDEVKSLQMGEQPVEKPPHTECDKDGYMHTSKKSQLSAGTMDTKMIGTSTTSDVAMGDCSI